MERLKKKKKKKDGAQLGKENHGIRDWSASLPDAPRLSSWPRWHVPGLTQLFS